MRRRLLPSLLGARSLCHDCSWALSRTVLQERLSLVAELAIALAGFASIVAIIGRRQGRDSPAIDAIRLQWMLGLSLFTTACALLPSLPFHAGLSEN